VKGDLRLDHVALALPHPRHVDRPGAACGAVIDIAGEVAQVQRMRARSPLSPRLGSIPDVIWAPASTVGLMLLVGVTAVVARCPWLFPSLGSTAFLQAEYPHHRSAGIYHVIVGHLLGVISGILAVGVLGAMDAPPATSGTPPSPVRLGAIALAVGTTIVLQLVLRASHPPAVSTSLLIALGAFPFSVHTAGTVVTGVLLVALPGEVLRRARLPAPAGS
jgi:HPP family